MVNQMNQITIVMSRLKRCWLGDVCAQCQKRSSTFISSYFCELQHLAFSRAFLCAFVCVKCAK